MRKFLYSVIVLIALALPVKGYAEEFIKIASFNIAEFGEGNHPNTRKFDFIARMLVDNDFDLIAIQEVGVTPQAEKQLNKLVKKMNDLKPNDPEYFSSITPVSGDERCAVIFRSPVVIEDDVLWLDDDQSPGNPSRGGTVYNRIPAAISFTAKNFDFYVVILHLTWGDKARRTREVKDLKEFLDAKDENEDDWIVLGDMNRYGKFGKTTTNRSFDLLLKGQWQNRYRFPLMEAITEPDDMKKFTSSKDVQSTTVAKGNNLYDQFIITQGAFNEFGESNPVLGTHVGIIPFDMKSPFKSMGHNKLKYAVSDHRPIWIRIRIDKEDDD